MTTPALAQDRPSIRFRGSTYPVLLPTVRQDKPDVVARFGREVS